MNDICRICFEECTSLNQKIENYGDVIEKVCQIKIIIDPSLPELICDMCLNGLLEADLLRDMCIKSHEDCLKSMINDDNNKVIEMEVDEAYVTETYDSESDVIKDVIEVSNPPRCCICAELFESPDLLRNHCLLKHSIELYEEPKDDQCRVCGVQYEVLEQLVAHVSILTTVVPDDATQERSETSSDSVVSQPIKHRRTKRKYKPGLTYICHICKKNIRGYETHIKKDHPNAPKEFQCHICNRSYSVVNSLISHMHNVHCRVKKFRCDICDKTFPRNALMLQHRETAHFNVKKFQCDVCQIKFARKQHLATHAKMHRKFKEVKCKVCNDVFLSQDELNEHLFKHIHGDSSFGYNSDLSNLTN